jgi:2-(1,2-epoxy-1,2-dihydrophenyl)acetyl-CoA isomerase
VTTQLIETFADGVATLTMNRPEARNALSGEMGAALMEAMPRLAYDPEVRVVVLTGANGAFNAGGDVKGFAADPTRGAPGGQAAAPSAGPSLEERAAGLRRSMEVSRWLHEMSKPTLAVIPGGAAGAGLSLALACDLRIAADHAKLTTAFAKVGLAGDYGGSYFMSHLIGAAKTRELYFLGEVITGAEAVKLGIVNRSVPAEELEAAAAEFARHLASLPPVAIGYMKRNLNTAEHATLAEVLDMEALHMARTMMTDDHKAAAMAFVQKRAPTFAGR